MTRAIADYSQSDLTALFGELAEAAAKETLPLFRSGTDVENKLEGDFDPVTAADRNAETALRNLITDRFPGHGITGEEHGVENADSEFHWILDPIDGTRSFISGLPLWGTLIGLYRNGTPWAGALSQPFLGELFVGVPGLQGEQATSCYIRHINQPVPLRCSGVEGLSNATLMTTSPRIFSEQSAVRYDSLEARVRLARYGCDCYAYGMLSAGQVDLVAEDGLNIYDIAALLPIITGAGGVVSGWEGEDPSSGGSLLASAGPKLHEEALKALQV